MHLFFSACLIHHNLCFFFLNILFTKIRIKRYDRHNRTHWTTIAGTLWSIDWVILVLYLVQPKIKIPFSHWTKIVMDSNLTLLLMIKKKSNLSEALRHIMFLASLFWYGCQRHDFVRYLLSYTLCWCIYYFGSNFFIHFPNLSQEKIVFNFFSLHMWQIAWPEFRCKYTIHTYIYMIAKIPDGEKKNVYGQQ